MSSAPSNKVFPFASTDDLNPLFLEHSSFPNNSGSEIHNSYEGTRAAGMTRRIYDSIKRFHVAD
jgi:hypothetical protein